MMPLVENMFDAPLPRLDGARTGWQDGRLQLGPLKLFADGGIRCAMCLHVREAILQFAVMIGKMLRHRSLAAWRLATQQKGRFKTGGTLHTGLLYYDAEVLQTSVKKACDAGFGVGIHAAGNEAIELAIAALAQSYRGALPPRIDHFFFVDQGPLRRAVGEGIHTVIQPIQLHDTGDLIRQTGLPPRLRFQAFGEMLSEGMILAGSSDAPVSTFDVLAGIDAAVRRQVASGATMSADQAIAISQALRIYTRGAAAALGMESEIGQLKRGARADAVVLSQELEKIPAERIREVQVVNTFAGRREWYQ
jgi:predicted amidohydrolase YtcJ